MLDDLAEVVLFDVVLATPARRRTCALAAGALALAAYASSGFWMTPIEPPAPPPAIRTVGAYGMRLPALEFDDTAAGVVRHLRVLPAQRAAFERWLSIEEATINGIMHWASHDLRDLSLEVADLGLARSGNSTMLLLARGIWYHQTGSRARAIADFIAALRLSTALTMERLSGQLTGHAIGSTLERIAIRQLCELIREHELDAAEAREIVRWSNERVPLGCRLARDRHEHTARDVAALIAWARSNRLPGAWSGLRFYLPVRESSRRAVAANIIARLEAGCDADVDPLTHGEPLPPPPAVHTVVAFGWKWHLAEHAGWWDRVTTLWSNDRAAELASRLIGLWNPWPHGEYARECQTTDREAEALREHCAELADESLELGE